MQRHYINVYSYHVLLVNECISDISKKEFVSPAIEHATL